MKIDLHMHTRYSDGGKTRIELIDLCRENKIDLISITDHNNFLVDNTKYDDIKIMRGMEVDTRYKDKTFHMLIYNFDLNSKELKKYKRNNRRYEIKNFREIVKQLEEKYNIKIPNKELNKFIRNNNYFDKTRLNELLVETSFSETPKDAYYQYTNCFEDNKRYNISMEKLFELEKDANAVVSLAHPLHYNISMDEMKKIILDLKEKYNLRCVEAINNRQTIEEEKELVKFCKKNNLYISSGSDAHYKFGAIEKKVVGTIAGRNITEKDATIFQIIGDIKYI